MAIETRLSEPFFTIALDDIPLPMNSTTKRPTLPVSSYISNY